MSDKGYNVIARVAGGILLLIAALLLLIQVPAVQSRLGRIVADRLENALDGKVSWSDIRIMAPNAVLIKDLLILDSNPYTEDEFDKGYPPTDTLGYLKTVAATFSLRGLLKGEGFHVRRAYVADGAFNLVIFQDGDRITNNINSIFRIPEKPAVRPEPGPDIFDIRRVKAKNVRYTMRNFTDNPFVYKGTGINWMDMDILVHEARGHGLKFTGGRMHGICDHISATEKCGFRLKDVSGSFAVGQGKTEVKDLVLVDNWSDLKLDEYTMHYDTPSSFAHYIDSVKMGAKRIRGTLDMRTINVYSGGALEGNELALDIKDGQASGYVSDFYVNKLRFTEKGSGVSGGISGRCTGLPDINAMLLDADVHDLTFRTDQLGSVIGNFAKGSDIDLSAYAPGQTLTLNGNVRGPMNGITFTGGVGTSSAGSLTTVATVRNILDKGRAVEIDADVTTRNLDVGKLAGGVPVGPVSLNTKASAVLSGGVPSIDLKDLDISDISALGHGFKGMKASGAFTKDGINGVITSTDPAADFNIRLDGTGMPKDGNADYKLSGTVSSVLLSAFGIDTKGMADSLSANLSGTLRNTAPDALEGSLEIYDVKVSGINGTATLENIIASLETKGNHADVQLSSEVLDAKYSGSSDIQKAISDIQKITTRRELPSIYKTPDKSPDFDGSDAYEMALVFHNPYTVLQFIAPKLYVSDSTRVNLNVDEEGNLVGRAVAPRLAYNGTYIKDAQIGFDNYDGLNATVTGSEIKAGAVMMKEPALTAFAEDDLFSVQLHYDNVAEVGSGEIYVNGLLERDAKNELVLTANPLDSYINVENQTWEFGESEIVVKGKDIDINRFLVSCGEQRLFVDGGISSSKKDTLDVYMDDFNLAIVDEFLENKLGVKGFLTGEAHVISPTGADMGMMLKFDAEQVAMGGTPLGNFNIAGRWDNDDNKIRAFVSNDLGERIPLTASLAYGVKDKNVSADLKLDGFSTAAVKPVVNSIMSDIGGTLSGHVTLSGNMDKPVISGEGCRIDSVFFRLIPTGVTYFLNGDFAVDGNEGLRPRRRHQVLPHARHRQRGRAQPAVLRKAQGFRKRDGQGPFPGAPDRCERQDGGYRRGPRKAQFFAHRLHQRPAHLPGGAEDPRSLRAADEGGREERSGQEQGRPAPEGTRHPLARSHGIRRIQHRRRKHGVRVRKRHRRPGTEALQGHLHPQRRLRHQRRQHPPGCRQPAGQGVHRQGRQFRKLRRQHTRHRPGRDRRPYSEDLPFQPTLGFHRGRDQEAGGLRAPHLRQTAQPFRVIRHQRPRPRPHHQVHGGRRAQHPGQDPEAICIAAALRHLPAERGVGHREFHLFPAFQHG